MTLRTPLVTLIWETFHNSNADQDLNYLLVQGFGQDQCAVCSEKSMSIDIFSQHFLLLQDQNESTLMRWAEWYLETRVCDHILLLFVHFHDLKSDCSAHHSRQWMLSVQEITEQQLGCISLWDIYLQASMRSDEKRAIRNYSSHEQDSLMAKEVAKSYQVESLGQYMM